MKKQTERCWYPAPEKPFVDRLQELWTSRKDTLNNAGPQGTSDTELTAGHKRMAGMP